MCVPLPPTPPTKPTNIHEVRNIKIHDLKGDLILTKVELRPNESQQQLFSRFRKQVAKSGKLRAIRKKRWFVSKSEVRRIAKKKAIRKQKRYQKNRQRGGK